MSDNKAIYDPEDKDTLEDSVDFFNPEPTKPKDPDDKPTATEKKKSLDSDELNEAESSEEANENIENEEASVAKSQDEEDFVYTGKRGGDGNILMRSKRRRRRAWVVALLLFPIFSFGLAVFMAGPLKLIHFGKMLENFHMGPNQTSSDTTLGRMVEYFRTGNDPSKRNVGYLAEKVSGWQQENLKTKGLTIKYDGPTGEVTRRIQSIEIDTSKPQGKKTLDALRAEGFDIPDPPDGKITELKFRNLEGPTKTALRRKALNITVEADGKNKAVTAVSKRLLRARAGVDFHPIKNAERTAKEKYEDWKKRRQDERSEQHRNGADGTDQTLEGKKDTVETEDGPVEVDNPNNDKLANSSNGIVNEADDVVNGPDVDVPGGRANFIKNLRAGMAAKSAGVAAAIIGTLCIARSIGDEIPAFQHANVILPKVRVGMESVAVASQTAAFFAGEGPPPNLDELRMLNEELDGIPIEPGQEVDPLSYGNSMPANAAETIALQSGESGGVPAPEATKVKVGEKPWLFDALDKEPLNGALDITCGAIDGAMKALKKVPVVGWGVSKLEDAQEAIINGGLEIAFNTSIEEVFAGILAFVSGGGIDVRALAGANKASVADAGVFFAEKEVAIAKGGTTLSRYAYQELRQEAWERTQYANSQKSLFTKTIDIRDTDSLLAQAVIKMPTYRVDDSILENTATMFSTLTKSVGGLRGIFSQKVGAQAPKLVDYGAPASGFSIAELEDEDYADPYANAEIVEPQLEVLNNYYGECFGTIIKPESENFKMVVNKSIDYKKTSAGPCMDGSDILTRYRMYILHQVTLRSAACYAGLDEESCVELGFENGDPSDNPTGPGSGAPVDAPGLNGYVVPCIGLPTALEERGARGDNINWANVKDSGVIGTNSGGQPMKVYIREACDTTNVKTVVIGSSIHASENYGQPISFNLLFKKNLPSNMRVIAIPEINGSRIDPSKEGRVNENGVNLNRNFDYRWNEMSGDDTNPATSNYRGPSPMSEPESKALVSFLNALGSSVSLFMVYHDNLDYVGSSADTNPALAAKYRDYLSSRGVSIKLGNAYGVNIKQKGSLDGWYNQATGRPAILVEMPAYSPPEQLDAHADAVIDLVKNGGI